MTNILQETEKLRENQKRIEGVISRCNELNADFLRIVNQRRLKNGKQSVKSLAEHRELKKIGL
jgi:hypothetical protein